MRVLFTTQPGSGHWRPLAPIARAMQAAGHQVAFATTPGYRPYIDRHGFESFSVGTDDALRNLTLSGPPSAPQPAARVWVDLFVKGHASESVADIIAICTTWKPSLVVREISEFGGCLAAERLTIPHAAVQVSAFRPHLHRLIAPALDRLRQSLGLPPDPECTMLYRYLRLSPVPMSYHRALELPPTTHVVQTLPFDGDGQELSGWVDRLPRRPTVYASLGTAYNQTPGIFEAILDALREEPINLIVTVGDGRDPSSFSAQPPNVRVVRYLPQSLLFPYCNAVVTHGGFGTLTTALAHGLPMVIIPIAADQPDNARRCAELGLAHVIVPSQRTPGTIRDAVRDVLATSSFRENAQRMRADMLALPPLQETVSLLERLAVDKQPVTGPRL